MHEPRVIAERILIVLLGAIGDVVRGLPLLTRLRRGYPDAQIAWAVEPLAAPIVQHHPDLNQVLVFDRANWTRSAIPFLRSVRRWRSDLTLDLQSHLKSGVISRTSGAPVRLAFGAAQTREGNRFFNTDEIDPPAGEESKLLQYQAFGDWLSLPTGPIDFGLRLTPDEEIRVDQLLAGVPRPFVSAFVGSSCTSRLWFPDRTAAVIDRTARRGVATVLLGAAGDTAFAAQVDECAKARVWNLAGRTTLRDLIGIFQRSLAAFGPDSGPMHIAAATGCPVVSLWGATRHERSAPWGSESHVLVGDAPCRPCYRKTCPIGRECMESIEIDAVAAELLHAMERSRSR